MTDTRAAAASWVAFRNCTRGTDTRDSGRDWPRSVFSIHELRSEKRCGNRFDGNRSLRTRRGGWASSTSNPWPAKARRPCESMTPTPTSGANCAPNCLICSATDGGTRSAATTATGTTVPTAWRAIACTWRIAWARSGISRSRRPSDLCCLALPKSRAATRQAVQCQHPAWKGGRNPAPGRGDDGIGRFGQGHAYADLHRQLAALAGHVDFPFSS